MDVASTSSPTFHFDGVRARDEGSVGEADISPLRSPLLVSGGRRMKCRVRVAMLIQYKSKERKDASKLRSHKYIYNNLCLSDYGTENTCVETSGHNVAR